MDTNKKIKKQTTIEEDVFLALAIGTFAVPIVVVIYYYILHRLGISSSCMFHHVTGAYCPGCGGTRAIISLLRGHIIQSIYYHPVVLYSVIMYILYMGSHILERLKFKSVKGMKFRPWYLYVVLFLIFLNFIVKNVLLFGYGISMGTEL